MGNVRPDSRFQGVYKLWIDGEERLATRSIAQGFRVYTEELVREDHAEYRVWNPFRSKLAAAILKGLRSLPIHEESKVLYLGASTGTTASHVSDLVGEQGLVYCVEFAARVMRELVRVCSYRRNMIPIMADALVPTNYRHIVGQVDVVYCDVAQPEQAKLLADNADMYLVKGGWALFAVKARSVDVTMDPSAVFKQEGDILEKRGFRVTQSVYLTPFEKDHAMILAQSA